MPRVFISYSRADETFARRLATSLSDMGADVWIDLEDIPAGMKWSSAIQEGLDTAQILIVVITPESMGSRNVEDEWQYYLDNRKPVIPIFLKQAKIHFQLSRIQYIDFLNQQYDRAMVQLHAELRRNGVQLAMPGSSSESTRPAEPEQYAATPRPAQVTQQARPVVGPPPRTALPAAPTWRNRNFLIGGAAGAVLLFIVLALLGDPYGDENGATQTANAQTAAAQAAQNPTATEHQAAPTDSVATATDTVVPTNNAPVRGIDTQISANTDWTPVERTINGVQMVLVPWGSLQMGASQRAFQANLEDCTNYPGFGENTCPSILSDEASPETIQVFEMQPYWIDKYEVSNRLYNGSGDNLPVTGVNWTDGQAHCSGRDSLTRLPTEPEWEYAASGPSDWRFPWGEDWDGSSARANICDEGCRYGGEAVGWALSGYRDGHNGPAPVDALPLSASWVGALNMGGNVWEYTSTIYQPYPYRESYENPQDHSRPRTLRGSSWQWVMFEATSTSRAEHWNNGPTSDFYGFRCVRAYEDGDLERFR